jgi:hypothetical protein
MIITKFCEKILAVLVIEVKITKSIFLTVSEYSSALISNAVGIQP